MKSFFIVLIALLSVIALSCSGPLDKEFNEDTVAEDTKEITESGDVSKEEVETLAMWIFSQKLQDKSLEGKTYGDLLTEAKAYKAEQEAIAAKAKAEADAKAKKLREAAVVSIYDKEFHEGEWQAMYGFNYVIKNKAAKDIDALKFTFNIYDKLGDKIGTGYSVSITKEEIPAGEEYKSAAYWDYNQFSNDDSKIKNAEMKDLVFDIALEKIVYTDGSTLE